MASAETTSAKHLHVIMAKAFYFHHLASIANLTDSKWMWLLFTKHFIQIRKWWFALEKTYYEYNFAELTGILECWQASQNKSLTSQLLFWGVWVMGGGCFLSLSFLNWLHQEWTESWCWALQPDEIMPCTSTSQSWSRTTAGTGHNKAGYRSHWLVAIEMRIKDKVQMCFNLKPLWRAVKHQDYILHIFFFSKHFLHLRCF